MLLTFIFNHHKTADLLLWIQYISALELFRHPQVLQHNKAPGCSTVWFVSVNVIQPRHRNGKLYTLFICFIAGGLVVSDGLLSDTLLHLL
jgi:hypothetical protein